MGIYFSMNDIKYKIKSLSESIFPEIVQLRRELHMYPELAFEEYNTARIISGFLEKNSIYHKTGIAKTGIAGLIHGKNQEGRCIALRADMDALPIREETDLPYKSMTDGKMHACGHDVHMACLLGASYILNHLKDQFNGSVKLIFQPSEEQYPGGAKGMIEEGVLKNPEVDAVIGQHVFPNLPAGSAGLKAGKYMASTDEIFLTVKGKGGHGATPELNIDPVVIAAHIILAMQQIVSRYANPAMPTVISFGRVIANGRTNVIPDEVKIEGIMRTFNESWREEIKQKIHKIAAGIAESLGGACEVFIDKGYPVLHNDEELSARVKNYCAAFLGSEHVTDLELRTTAEDFAYFALEKPSCFYRLGIRNEQKGIVSNLHTSTFNVDENSIATGMELLAWIAINELRRIE